jgi:hypothetical protein
MELDRSHLREKDDTAQSAVLQATHHAMHHGARAPRLHMPSNLDNSDRLLEAEVTGQFDNSVRKRSTRDE